jgi:hypothetical protein
VFGAVLHFSGGFWILVAGFGRYQAGLEESGSRFEAGLPWVFASHAHKKAPCFRMRLVCLIDAWQFPTLAWGDPTLPSALRRFTSEFGMGSGGTTALKPPGKFCYSRRHKAAQIYPVQAENICLCLSDTHQNASGVVRLSLTGH